MKKYFSCLFSCVLTTAILILGLKIGELIGWLGTSYNLFGVIAETGLSYLSFAGVWIVFLGFIAVTHEYDCLYSMLPHSKGNTVLFSLFGILIGFLLNAVCACFAILHGDISVAFVGFDVPAFLFLFFSVLIQSGAEEFACRIFLYRRLLKDCGIPLAAIVINSLLFGLLHLANTGVTATGICNSVFFGLFLSLFIFYWDSSWCVICIHTAWNFTQNIIFGLPNSGRPPSVSVFTSVPSGTGSTFFYDPSFGLEGSLFAGMLLFTVTLVLFFTGRKLTGK